MAGLTAELRRMPSPWTVALALLFAASLVTTSYGAIKRDLFAHGWNDIELQTTLAVVLGVAAWCTLGFALRAARHLIFALLALLALGLAGLPAVAGVTLLLAACYVIGDSILTRCLAWHADGDNTLIDATLATLLGAGIAVVLMAVLARMRIHYAPLYILAFGAIAWSGQRRLRVLAKTVQLARARLVPMSVAERGLVILLVVCFALHWLVMLKPEVGYDALAMHLVVPYELAREHRWHFDITRFVWAVMPMAGDWWFTFAFMLGGEAAARLGNVFAMLAGWGFLYVLLRRVAPRSIALAALLLFGSSPLLYVESGTLFIEHVQNALLLGGTYAFVRYRETDRKHWLFVAASLFGAAITAKVISVFAAAGVAAWLLAGRKPVHASRQNILQAALLFGLFAAPPFVMATWSTGNPVFPYFNSIFKSPFFDPIDFTNPMYVLPLRWTVLWDLTFESHRYFESYDGSFGLQYCSFLAPALVALALPAENKQSRALALACLAIGLIIFFGVYSSQAYIRYLYPSMALLMIPLAYGLSRLAYRATKLQNFAVLAAILVAIANLELIPAGAWWNRTLCLRCSIDQDARAQYIEAYAPERAIIAYLNQTAPNQHVGFFHLNTPFVAGYRGETRSDSWHDVPMYKELGRATSAEEVAAIARKFGLTYFVFHRSNDPDANRAVVASFRDRYTRPVYEVGGLLLSVWKDR